MASDKRPPDGRRDAVDAGGETLRARPAARAQRDSQPSTVELEPPGAERVTPPGEDTAPIADVADDAEVATMFRAARFADRYRKGEMIGAGGMGEVRRLTDRASGRVVAMKTIRADREHDGLRRFAREARIQAQLEHPSVVPVYDVGVDDGGGFYFTMKQVRGQSLAAVLTQLRAGDATTVKRFSLRKLLTVLSTVAMTLEYAHRRGVVHRDLKPSNIMLGAFGEVYLLDWGLADVKTGTSTPPTTIGDLPSRIAIMLPADAPLVDSSLQPRTDTGVVLGTPGYAAPEQITDPPVSNYRADIYALGVILFETLTRERLHGATTVPEVFASTLKLDGASPRQRAPGLDVPPELDQLARAATRLDPERRPASAAAFARAIEAYLDGDRDVEARRRLAGQSAEAAEAALTAARTGGTDEAAARTVALREVTTALGLDPDNARARALLIRLLTEPARSTIAAAEDANRDAATRSYRLAARNAIFALCTYALYVPLILWMGLRHVWMLGTIAGSIGGLIAVTYYYYRRPPHDLRVPLVHVVASTVAMASGVVIMGPLVLLPAIAIANGTAYMASMRNRGGAVIASCLAVVLVPLLLQVLGVVPPWYAFDGGGVRILPWMTDLPPAATLTFLAVTHAVVITASLVFVARLRQSYLEAERRARVQAWQLAQIVPEHARPPAM